MEKARSHLIKIHSDMLRALATVKRFMKQKETLPQGQQAVVESKLGDAEEVISSMRDECACILGLAESEEAEELDLVYADLKKIKATAASDVKKVNTFMQIIALFS